ncbi:transposase [Arthrobacter dokdonensis]
MDYPCSGGEYRSWFASDADCLDCLAWVRWPKGSVCPRCSHAGG